MKFIKQFCIILLVSFLGEAMRYFIPLPVPASIYGLLLMLLSLKFKIIKIDHVRGAALFLLEIMPIMFIPAAVELLTAWNILKVIWLQIFVISIVSTIAVIVIGGSVTQIVIRQTKKQKEK